MEGSRQFQRWGWVIAGALALFDVLMVNDLFFRRPGELGLWEKWHGAPWPLALALASPLAHVWLLLIVVLRGLERERGPADISRGLVSTLVSAVAVFHALFWDNGSWLRGLLSVGS
jgi:hypothetical protein